MRLTYIASVSHSTAEAASREEALTKLLGQVPTSAQVRVQLAPHIELPEQIVHLMTATIPNGHVLVIVRQWDTNPWKWGDVCRFVALPRGPIQLMDPYYGKVHQYDVKDEPIVHRIGPDADEVPLPEGSLMFPLSLTLPRMVDDPEDGDGRAGHKFTGGSWTLARSLRFDWQAIPSPGQ